MNMNSEKRKRAIKELDEGKTQRALVAASAGDPFATIWWSLMTAAW